MTERKRVVKVVTGYSRLERMCVGLRCWHYGLVYLGMVATWKV